MRLLLLGLALGLATTATCTTVVVVIVMALQNLLAEFLLALVDIRVELVAVLTDRELLVIINWNLDLARANWLVVGVVELGHVGVSQGLLCSQALVGVELQEASQKVEGIIRSSWEHIG
jgi:hypothetical protein